SDYLAQNTMTLEKAADYFKVSLGEVLSELSTKENMGIHQVKEVAKDAFLTALESSHAWGKLRGIIRTDSGAITELFLNSCEFELRKQWLNIENEAFHLHINWRNVTRVYFASRESLNYSLNFVDDFGKLVFRLSLMKQDGEFNPTTLQSYFEAQKTVTGSTND
ncbi:MAG: hypothetical protein KAG06_08470, partial [Methylococcales bacterium]|nr:hypothetical protein [Methylococcales bacterium]